ncbi:hypothetical protein KEM48_004542 [Puccinia striiformis f. sp. tritici PST-130]|nr:hypothetical protein Pst134EB_023485 [Puccinia striiformis f. sp. tritici]KAI9611301.1 hypothetical protein KEM48_004542 [Puccinia striiformis f. sp. tritici PST-130]
MIIKSGESGSRYDNHVSPVLNSEHRYNHTIIGIYIIQENLPSHLSYSSTGRLESSLGSRNHNWTLVIVSRLSESSLDPRSRL